ncbi:MAG: S9 family peptidase, partial [Rhodospirillales bacterium]|nr:S9 family peptidase [Rhodospirillales bacterium]
MQKPGTTGLIPRQKLFGNPTRAQAKISPDGRWLSWLAPRDGVLNVCVAPAGDMDATRAITNDRKRGIRFHGWALDSCHVLYMQDEGGTEEWHIYAVDVSHGTVRDLTPLAGVTAYIHDLVIDQPGIAAIALNDRDKAWHDVYRVDIRTGERELIVENKQELASIVLDRQLRPRIATKARPEGGSSVFRMDGTALELIRVVEHEDDLTTSIQGFTRDGSTLYLLSSIGCDKAALLAMDWQTGTEQVLAEHPKADISQILRNPETEVAEAAAAEHLKVDWIPLNERMAGDLKRLHGLLPGNIDIADRTQDDTLWIVRSSAAESPGDYHLYERNKGTVTELFTMRPELKPYRLAPMHSQTIRARDGLELVSYLTVPEGQEAGRESPPPMVLLVHGGPWARDGYGYHAQHQWLANRGYAVMSVNFRGSTGFGEAFLNAGNREWGGRMQEDLLDAVQWAVTNGIAQADRVAIVGQGFGGYAALAGLAFAPDQFRCAASYGAPANLSAVVEGSPASARDAYYLRVG